MARFDDDAEESEGTTESGSWGVDETESPEATGAAKPDPLADLDTATVAADDPSGTLKRAVDPEAGVVIYADKNGNAGGLSAVPLTDTDLTGDSE
jgi:hypothetical protein